MKKTIALVLAMLMVLSMIPLVFAEVVVVGGDDSGDETETPECIEDADCEEDKICVEGECEDVEEEEEEEIEVEDEDENETEEEEEEEIEVEYEDENETEDEDVIVIVSGNNETNQTEEPECVEDADCGEGEICSEGVCQVEIPEEVTEEAGITPDSPLYGLERAMERISLALTFGKSAKAKKGLAHAHERLMEVQAMIAAKKLAKAQVAEEGYQDTMEEVEENLEEIGDGDGEQELADNVEIEEALAENEEALQAVNQIRLKVSKSLGEAEKAQIQTMLQSLEGVNSAFKVKVQANKNKAKIKIKAEKGATDEEIATLENALKQGKELAGVRITKKGAGVVKKEKPAKVNGKNNNKGSNGEEESEDEEEEEEEPECVEDADCEEGKVCVEGACEDVEDEEPEDSGNETTS